MNTFLSSGLASFLALATTASAVADTNETAVQNEVPVPLSMGALGDSITAGAMANYRRKDAVQTLPLFLAQALAAFAKNDFTPFERRDYSWSTGHFGLPVEVKSHARRLKELLPFGTNFKVKNAAVSGAESLDVLQDQWPKLRQWSHDKLGRSAPEYVTLLIGANNVCRDLVEDMTPTEVFMSHVGGVMDEILATSPDTHIMVSALPAIETLRDVASDSKLLGFAPAETCRDFWELANVCFTLTREEDPARRAMVAERVRDYNLALRHYAETRRAQYGDRVRVSWNVYEGRFTDNDISVDCFHPNPEGQNKIADYTWTNSWWSASAK